MLSIDLFLYIFCIFSLVCIGYWNLVQDVRNYLWEFIEAIGGSTIPLSITLSGLLAFQVIGVVSLFEDYDIILKNHSNLKKSRIYPYNANFENLFLGTNCLSFVTFNWVFVTFGSCALFCPKGKIYSVLLHFAICLIIGRLALDGMDYSVLDTPVVETMHSLPNSKLKDALFDPEAYKDQRVWLSVLSKAIYEFSAEGTEIPEDIFGDVHPDAKKELIDKLCESEAEAGLATPLGIVPLKFVGLGILCLVICLIGIDPEDSPRLNFYIRPR